MVPQEEKSTKFQHWLRLFVRERPPLRASMSATSVIVFINLMSGPFPYFAGILTGAIATLVATGVKFYWPSILAMVLWFSRIGPKIGFWFAFGNAIMGLVVSNWPAAVLWTLVGLIQLRLAAPQR